MLAFQAEAPPPRIEAQHQVVAQADKSWRKHALAAGVLARSADGDRCATRALQPRGNANTMYARSSPGGAAGAGSSSGANKPAPAATGTARY